MPAGRLRLPRQMEQPVLQLVPRQNPRGAEAFTTMTLYEALCLLPLQPCWNMARLLEPCHRTSNPRWKDDLAELSLLGSCASLSGSTPPPPASQALSHARAHTTHAHTRVRASSLFFLFPYSLSSTLDPSPFLPLPLLSQLDPADSSVIIYLTFGLVLLFAKRGKRISSLRAANAITDSEEEQNFKL
jgi:hypothetical protein